MTAQPRPPEDTAPGGTARPIGGRDHARQYAELNPPAPIVWPVDAYGPAALIIDVIQAGEDHSPTSPCLHTWAYWPCFATRGGRVRVPIGDSTFPTPAEAQAFCRQLDGEAPRAENAAPPAMPVAGELGIAVDVHAGLGAAPMRAAAVASDLITVVDDAHPALQLSLALLELPIAERPSRRAHSKGAGGFDPARRRSRKEGTLTISASRFTKSNGAPRLIDTAPEHVNETIGGAE